MNPTFAPLVDQSGVPSTSVVRLLDDSTSVFLLKALIAALTSGLGGLPLYILGDISPSAMGQFISFAAGMMGGASILLFVEAFLEASWWPESPCYFFLGGASVHLISKVLEGQEDITFLDLKGAQASRALMIFLSMSLHSLGEGISVAVSNTADPDILGFYVLVSLAIHNIPEGVAVALIMRNQGMTIAQGSLVAVASNLPQPLMAVIAFMFLKQARTFLPLGLGYASGSMLYVVFSELIPDAREKVTDFQVWLITSSAAGAVCAVFAADLGHDPGV